MLQRNVDTGTTATPTYATVRSSEIFTVLLTANCVMVTATATAEMTSKAVVSIPNLFLRS